MTDELTRLPSVPIDTQTHYKLRRHLLDAGGTISDFIREAIKEKLSRLKEGGDNEQRSRPKRHGDD